jgi:hypothetical protein
MTEYDFVQKETDPFGHGPDQFGLAAAQEASRQEHQRIATIDST